MKKAILGALQRLERISGSGGILAYHGVGPEPFFRELHVTQESLRTHLEFFTARYDVVPLQTFVDRVRRGVSIRGCIALTFDDAYSGIVESTELFRKFGVPATLFVTTGHARTGDPFWWDVVERVRTGGTPEAWGRLLERVGASGLGAGSDPAEHLHRWVLSRMVGRADGIVREFGHLLNEPCWRPARADQLRRLGDVEGISFGVHSVTHPVLPRLSRQEQIHEIGAALDWLREHLPRRTLPFLAYPYGLYDDGTVRAAREAGMAAAFSVQPRPPSRSDGLMSLPRLVLRDLSTPARIPRDLSPLAGLLRRLRGSGHPKVPTFPG